MFERPRDFVACAIKLGPTPRDICSIFWRQTKNARVRLGLGNYHPRHVYALRTKYGQLYFRDNFGDVTNLTNLFYREAYRLKKLSHPGVILDIGANIGMAAAWFAFHNSDRAIYCFEPLPENADMIKLNCPQAQVVPYAAGAERGQVYLQVDADNVMASQFETRWPTETSTFETISLDEFVQAEAIKLVALLKIDTEGMELDVIDGAVTTLAMTEQVAMETHGRYRHDESIRKLETAGFIIDAQTFGEQTGMIFASRVPGDMDHSTEDAPIHIQVANLVQNT